MSRVTMVLIVLAGLLLLGTGVSGFKSDAEVSSERLGSDFDDAHFQRFNENSVERVQQMTRRQEIGLEVMGGIALLGAGLFFFTPKKKEFRKPAAATAAVAAPVRQRPETVASAIQLRYAANRRRPKGMTREPGSGS